MTIGQTIKIYRKDKGLTQSEMAELIGVSSQAISKWETNSGMPDISLLVPIARVLEISTDKLLGHTSADFETELLEIKRRTGNGINFIPKVDYFIDDLVYAENLYSLSSSFFNKHPDIADVAVICLECYVELYSKKKIEVTTTEFIEQCERYANSIFRYETDPDRIYKSYYLMSRAYDLVNEKDEAESYLKKLPQVFGFRDYWEAEIAYADNKNEIALEKIKKSFAIMARFTSRCIRLAGRIVRAEGRADSAQVSIQLDEYMLRLIDAFLSGGDYLPHRQIFQKTALLQGLVSQHAKLGNTQKAEEYLAELIKTKEDYIECMKAPENKHCLMFNEGDNDCIWGVTEEKLNTRIDRAKKALNKT